MFELTREFERAGLSAISAPVRQHTFDSFPELLCFSLKTDGIAQEDLCHEAIGNVLSKDEVHRLSSIRNKTAALQFACGRMLIRQVLSEYIDPKIPTICWNIHAPENHKPALCRKTHPCTLDFSISHTPGIIVCVLAADGMVGIDIENINRSLSFASISTRIFSHDERMSLVRSKPSELRSTFFRYWTLKEAFSKATGNGLSRDFAQINFSLEHPLPQLIKTDQLQDAHGWLCESEEIDSQFLMSVAYKRSHSSAPTMLL